MTNQSSIVLTSGGLDSTTCLAIAKSDGFTKI
jgi:7-cyano-7-deazaguanine synthase in queuosine biosynthesis